MERSALILLVARRAARALLGAVVALGLMLVMSGGPAVAAPAADGAILLAVDGAELLGPDPVARDAEENPARELGGYEDREVPFTWGAAWLLTFLGLGGLATMGLVYWRAVERPGRGRAPVGR